MASLLSVIVPTFNRAYCVARSIDSALSQTWRNVEVVVVDDGSTDGTPDLMKQRYGGDTRVRYIRQENTGVSGARNTALRLAQGDYIAFLDSDDLWSPWKAELQIRCLEALPGVGMVWTDMEAVDESGAVVNPRYLRTMYSAYGEVSQQDLFSSTESLGRIWPKRPAACLEASVFSGDIFSCMILGNLVHTSTVMLTRERFSKVKFFREDLRVSGEDYDYHLRTCREGLVAFVDVASIRYQTGRGDQLTRPGMGRWVSQNFLNTILPAIERDRARITLPQARLDAVVAEAYSWLGSELLHAQAPGSFRALWNSFKLHRDARTGMLLLASCMPSGWFPTLQALKRAVWHTGRSTQAKQQANRVA